MLNYDDLRIQPLMVAASATLLGMGLALQSAFAAVSTGMLYGAPDLNTAPGFAADVTGGAGGKTVVVTSPAQLANALCAKRIGDRICVDDEPRIIKIKGVLDFNTRALSNYATSAGCYLADKKSCDAKGVPEVQREKIVIRYDEQGKPKGTYCNGMTMIPNMEWNQSPSTIIGNNKTVIGVGAKSGIKGRMLGIYGKHNIIIRNLTISDVNENIVFAGDGIEIGDSDKVWIDHNHFTRIGRQWITIGNEKSGAITISNNEFDGRGILSKGHNCDGEHYWGVISSGDGEKVTMVGNWFHHFSGRTPDIAPNKDARTAVVHLANNLFENSHGHGMESTPPSHILLEGNVYMNVDTPIEQRKNTPAGTLYAPFNGVTATSTAICNTAQNRKCVSNIATGFNPNPFAMKLQDAATLNPAVLKTFAPVSAKYMAVPYAARLTADRVRAYAGPKAALQPQ